MKKLLLTAAFLFAVLATTGCEDEKTLHHYDNTNAGTEYYEEPRHVIHHSSDSGLNGVVTGMAIGAMMSNNGGGSSHTTVNKTVINKTYTAPSGASTPAPTKASTSTASSATKASYRPSKPAAATPQAKAKYRKPTTSSYKPTKAKAKYRPKKKSSSWGYSGSSKKSSYRKKR